MEGMIRNATDYNFLSEEYTLLNIYVALDSEGKKFSTSLPRNKGKKY